MWVNKRDKHIQIPLALVQAACRSRDPPRRMARLERPSPPRCGPRICPGWVLRFPCGTPPGASEMSHSPFEQDEVDETEVFGQAVAEDPVWVAMPDLVGGQAKVDALHQVPGLSHMVEVKPPANAQKSRLSWLFMGLSAQQPWTLRDPHCVLDSSKPRGGLGLLFQE